jgi:methylase of polypeptide subunit release factors
VTGEPLHHEFAALLELQPYTVVIEGLVITVGEDVFPPDLGRCARNMAKICAEYRPRRALDMGCGTGFLALALKRLGVPDVWALDVHEPAIACTRKNLEQNPNAGPVTIVRSDLFEAVPPSVVFDLVVFNQPYAPAAGDGVCGCGPDGGSEITRRFLVECRSRLAPRGCVMMAFSNRASREHDPALVARELGYSSRTLLHAYYEESDNFIYELRPERVQSPALRREGRDS